MMARSRNHSWIARKFTSAVLVLVLSATATGCSSNASPELKSLSASPSATSWDDKLGILKRLNSLQEGWATDKEHDKKDHSVAVYASPGNEGCWVAVFKSESAANAFGSDVVTNASQPPMYWHGEDIESNTYVVLLAMGAIFLKGSENIPRCESTMEMTFGVELLSSL